MIKLALTLLAIAAALAGILLGPDLLDAWRLEQYIASSTQAYDTNGGAWPHLSDACVSCHGANGDSVNQNYPVLAGQRAVYLSEQLHAFAGGQRVYPIMNSMARSLKEDEIAKVADYFARQAAGSNRYFKPDEKLRQKGERLVSAGACAGCHGDGLMGRDRFPRLAGQGYDYLLRQLNGFADGTRRDPGNTMNQLASAWSPEDRQAIAEFLASHFVPQGGKP